jgi:acyl carrier protein
VTRAELRRIVAGALEIEPDLLQADADLRQFESFDSVGVLSLMIELDEKAGVKMSPEEANSLQRYGEIEGMARRQGVELTD